MAKLDAKERKALPSKDFAGPDRSYPIEDKAHARDAKARASEEEHKGDISASTERRIDRRADRVLGRQEGDHHHGGKPSMSEAARHLDRHKARAAD